MPYQPKQGDKAIIEYRGYLTDDYGNPANNRSLADIKVRTVGVDLFQPNLNKQRVLPTQVKAEQFARQQFLKLFNETFNTPVQTMGVEVVSVTLPNTAKF